MIQSLNGYFDPSDELLFVVITSDSFVASSRFVIFHVVIGVIYGVEAVVVFIFIIVIIFGLSLYGCPFLLASGIVNCRFC